jgi:hypothetical protein
VSPLERLLGWVLVFVTLVCCGWLGLQHYGTEQYEAGRAAAIAAGDKLRQDEAERNRETESDLRARLSAADADAYRKEQEYATNLEAAQRRVRAGVDRLRCPASTLQPAAQAQDRPAAGGPVPEPERPGIVPETAADLLGIAADVAGLVRKFDRVTERFEACRRVNSQ